MSTVGRRFCPSDSMQPHISRITNKRKLNIFQVNNYSYQILSRICIHICMNKNFVCIVFPLPIFLACFTRDMGHALRLQQFAFL